MLIVEAHNHVPLSDLDVSRRDNDPDDGVDAKIRWPNRSKYDILEAGKTVLQYKSGKISPKQLRDEFRKKGVKKTLQRGGRYILLVGNNYD